MHKHAELDWRDGRVPVSTRFDDPYFSLDDGLSETRHVFLAGNGLPERFTPGFRIAELGFGTGLNLLAALEAWRASGTAGPLRFTTFEAFPMAPEDMIRAQGVFPELAEIAATLEPMWRDGRTSFETDELIFEMRAGDARTTLTAWDGIADAWFLDGFSPAKNPELWEPALLASVAEHTAQGGTAATYSAAGEVRRALAAAGFAVSRVPGYGRKRHMSVARKEIP
ncbi:tRNA (5-methylaminomethyl-2-thiouridine)(34)-methyltransferase MnmD [Roseivivax sp. THAF30]|uniref:tRNA (5-methylaminomethyl-2-thiouridine)(34)-methyltransferase MnmD n=1 Tax=Roseivivax sp. THAF30 TaxID=2587852 RepID=UPI00126816A5|nr:tRNA (5-methylaminomethyl-2-thiouridine)(34)-methyltransferase MnmD [Roseivivax sp. THAF30]QFT61467.1 tRNA 5-methylaminomethyl-2-thiouridine biosynthesis bifunctional protein MnmC [Roseivivax sp. THAF30]